LLQWKLSPNMTQSLWHLICINSNAAQLAKMTWPSSGWTFCSLETVDSDNWQPAADTAAVLHHISASYRSLEWEQLLSALSFVTASPFTTLRDWLYVSSSFHSDGSIVRNVIGSLRRRNIVFQFAVQNWSSPYWSWKADGSTCECLGGWSGAGMSIATTISFLGSTWPSSNDQQESSKISR